MGCNASTATVAPHEDNNPRDDVIVPPSEPDPKDDETLRVINVDFQVEQNAKEHHTEEYDITQGGAGVDRQLVIRRGQPFRVKINFSRPYNRNFDDLRLVFQTGIAPSRRRGTFVEFVLSNKDLAGQWGATTVNQEEKTVEMKVFVPPECIVDKWHFKVDVVTKKDATVKVFRYSHKDPIYILFNPWCREDTVYLDGAALLEEYVLNEQGRIWVGSAYRSTAKPWNFGQFSGNVLDCCMYLLAKCSLDAKYRGNAVRVVRQLTAVVNAPDDNGVLVGNWSGNYSDGKSPLSWTGSAPILEQFYKEKRPVKYGQCWVFSGVLTAVCRAIGIPARSVTNFSSAHDVDGSITIDKVLDEDGEEVRGENEDSVWNFHVWNDVWMARPDLPHGYGGWQACDATPQERSDGVYCCGPCPVRAIKEGEVNLAFDGAFIFAEVNADRITWVKGKKGSYNKTSVDKKAVGKNMSTKAVGTRKDREDVTNAYKHPDLSTGERVALRRAQKCSSSYLDAFLEEDPPKDVDFELRFDGDNTFVGDDFTLTVAGQNKTSETRTVKGVVVVKTMTYTGVAGDVVAKESLDLRLEAQQCSEMGIKVTEEDYRSKLRDMCMLSFTVMVKVQETGQIFTKTEQARLRKPHLEITGPTSAQMGEEFEVQLSFTNPLSCKLTNCYLELESHGITGDKKKYDLSNVDAKEKFTDTLKLKGTKRGKREVVLIFNCDQLEDINSTHEVQVNN